MPVKILSLLSFMAFSTGLNAQKLTKEAFYKNRSNELYKIEQKYVESNKAYYVVHGNNASYCMKRTRRQNGDTLRMTDRYYLSVEVDSPGKKFRMLDTADELKATNADRLSLIRDNKLTVSLDTLTKKLLETHKIDLVNQIPVKVKTFHGESDAHSKQLCQVNSDQLVCRFYFINDSLDYYRVDTLSWNTDTTNITWTFNRFEWGPKTVKFQLKGNTLISKYEGKVKTITYMNEVTMFNHLLFDLFVYVDPWNEFELRAFEREKIVKATYSGEDDTEVHKYKTDEKGRITSKKVYKKATPSTKLQLARRINFIYH